MTPHDRFRALSAADRAFWLDPAERAFLAEGYQAASVNRLIAGLTTSKGRFYHYFDDKAALYRATLDRALGRIPRLDDTRLLHAPDAAAFWDEAQALAGRVAAALRSDTTLATLLRGLHAEPEAQRAMAATRAALTARLTRIARAGQALGAVRSALPADLLARTGLEMLHGIDRWFADRTPGLSVAEETRLAAEAFSLIAGAFRP